MPDQPEHQPILASCAGDATVRVFTTRLFEGDRTTHQPLRLYSQHTGRVKRIAALDAHCLISAAEDGTVRLFDLFVKSTSFKGLI